MPTTVPTTVPTTWDPATYLRFAEERSRPFAELLARVDVDARTVVDLGCGPGHLTEQIRARWPRAHILGLDTSTQMVATARKEHALPDADYEVRDLREWSPDEPVDLVLSNATLQWVPGHLELLPGLADAVAVGGSIAFSVPGNFAEPSHVLLRELADEQPYVRWTWDIERPSAYDAASYLDVLGRPGWIVDAWETTYLHVLSGSDPVFGWLSGTGARPVLQALPARERQRFETTFKSRLRAAYPSREYGTVLPFRRVFVVARRQEG